MKATPFQIVAIEGLLRKTQHTWEDGFAMAVSKFADLDDIKNMTLHQAAWLIKELKLRAEGDESRKQRESRQ